MTHALHDPIRHNSWANIHLLEFCQRLDEQTLNATVPGTYGTITATLRHIIFCEIDSLERLLGQAPSDPWHTEKRTGLGVLLTHAARMATDWERFLSSNVDSEHLLPLDEGDTPVPAGVVIAVVIYHGSEHRGQVCTILSALGHEPPDLTPWAYAFASGRIRV